MITVQHQRGQRLFFFSHTKRKPSCALIRFARDAGFIVVDAMPQAQIVITNTTFARKVSRIPFWQDGHHEYPVVGADELRAQIFRWNTEERETTQRERAEQESMQVRERQAKAQQRRDQAALRRQHRQVGACRRPRGAFGIGI